MHDDLPRDRLGQHQTVLAALMVGDGATAKALAHQHITQAAAVMVSRRRSEMVIAAEDALRLPPCDVMTAVGSCAMAWPATGSRALPPRSALPRCRVRLWVPIQPTRR